MKLPIVNIHGPYAIQHDSNKMYVSISSMLSNSIIKLLYVFFIKLIFSLETDFSKWSSDGERLINYEINYGLPNS